jgi:hypothetical protein
MVVYLTIIDSSVPSRQKLCLAPLLVAAGMETMPLPSILGLLGFVEEAALGKEQGCLSA